MTHHGSRALLLLYAALAVGYLGLWVFSMDEGLLWRSDFTAFYSGWAIARDGQTDRLYDFDLQRSYQEQILGGHRMADGLLPYVNPPHATLVFLPLARLPFVAAYRVWTAVELGMLLAALWLLSDLARGWEPRERLLLLAAFLAFPPLLAALVRQTFSLFGLVALLLLRRGLRSGRPGLAGAALALGSLKPQLVLLPGLALLAARRWRAFAAAALLCGGLAALATAALGWRCWPDFLQALQRLSGYFGVYGVAPGTMYNLRGTLALLLGAERAGLVNALGSLGLALAAAATLPCWRGPWRPDGPGFELRFGLTALLGLLSSPHLHTQDGLLFALPLALGYAALREDPRAGRAFGAFALACPALFLLGELLLDDRLGVRAPTLLMAGLAAWMARRLMRNA